MTSAEAGRNKKLRRICDELEKTSAFQSGELTCEQILEELAERAAPYYQRLWQACDADERVVLEHVAQHGLASAASRRVVRRLLGKGLLRKDPDLRLMNQSFRALRPHDGVPQGSGGARRDWPSRASGIACASRWG